MIMYDSCFSTFVSKDVHYGSASHHVYTYEVGFASVVLRKDRGRTTPDCKCWARGLLTRLAGPAFKPVLRVDGSLLALAILQRSAQDPAATRILMVLAIVDVVDERIVFDGVAWSAVLQHGVARLDTQFAQWIPTLVACPSVIMRMTAEPVLQVGRAEFPQAFVCVTSSAFVHLRCVVRHVVLSLEDFTAHTQLVDIVDTACMHRS